MNNEEKIEKINKWQTSGVVHELTCGNDNCRGILDAQLEDGNIVLVCPECNDYIQTWIPEIVFKFDIDAHKQNINNFFIRLKERSAMKKEMKSTANWMKEYVEEAGAKGFVVGLSGGLDSSVIACLAVQAVGNENVIGISLPCQTRKDMKTDAKKLADNLGIRFETIDIARAVGYTADGMKQAGFSSDVTPLVLANIKARTRMNNLYAVAGATNSLVAGTGNLSELEVGYFTKFGDGGVDIEPIGNFYKTEVYKMAEFMPEIPKGAITKAPSADLWEGQTDEDELGMAYAELDEILHALLNPNASKLDKFDIDKISKVQRMRRNSGHKNKVPPRYIREVVSDM